MLARAAVTELILEVFRLNGHLLAPVTPWSASWDSPAPAGRSSAMLSPSPVPLPVSQVARNMALSRQSVQRIANELESQGILRFEPNPHHRRAKLVLLTEQGRALLRCCRQAPEAVGERPRKRLANRQVEAARDLLRTLRRRLENEAGDDDEP